MSNPIQTADRLVEILITMRRLYGPAWPERARPYRAILQDLINKGPEKNVLAVATSVADGMAKQGHNPIMVLAVAAEMCEGAT